MGKKNCDEKFLNFCQLKSLNIPVCIFRKWLFFLRALIWGCLRTCLLSVSHCHCLPNTQHACLGGLKTDKQT